MILGEGLVLKLVAIDGLAARSVTGGEVTTLDHELLDNTVEARALVVKRLACLAYTPLTSAQAAEVLGRPGYKVGEQFHGDTASRLSGYLNVEENARAVGSLILGHVAQILLTNQQK